ncbi:hypothetical protein FTO70_07285 [Methanosarcina sp. KYL-1]|uniref:hypothetical protein n=1 Tax=Methanosarcina sp. KYL-1 TaxID=2602068 RepID=UPI0021014984|nr:hypothetical protein [Methanosarcina sp. KYL-1]MCQ1535490.1 hypothetical protein [Methanosarcina sp. KYL-1]
MLKVEVSKKNKIVMLALLLIQNIVIRIPSIPHEKGFDSFFIHSLANSITTFGQANWWINWLSVAGLYPYSYASALPFSLSGFSQIIGLTGIHMEKSILLYSILIGLFSVFTTYVLAGHIYDDFLFKYVTAFLFSTSQGILVFTTWEPSSRGLFMVLLPLFLFALLSKIEYLKSSILVLMIGVFLATTHNFFYFLFPLTIIYVFLTLFSKAFSQKTMPIHINFNFNYLYLFGLSIVFLIPFIDGSMIKAGSRYGWIISMLTINTRFIGPLIFFAASGIIYLAFKKNKILKEWYFLILILILIPFNYNPTYGTYVLLLYLIIFISIAFRNLLDASVKSTTYKVFVVFLILSSTVFSSYYNHERTNRISDYNWFMKDSTYSASVWSNEYIPQNKYGFGIGESNRLFVASDGHPIMPLAGTSDLAYGFINGSQIEVSEVSPTSSSFYFNGPYLAENSVDIQGKTRWMLENDIDYKGVKPILKSYDLSYFIMPSTNSGRGIQSIRSKKSSIFDDGGISIWIID